MKKIFFSLAIATAFSQNFLLAQTATLSEPLNSFSILSGTSVTAKQTTTVEGSVGAIGTVDTTVKAIDTTLQGSVCVTQRAMDSLIAVRSRLKQMPAQNLGTNTLSNTSVSAGTYDINSSLTLSGTITLTGDSTSKFIFNVDGKLTFDANTQLILSGGVKSENIFFNVDSSVVVKDSAVICGNILADGTICCSKDISAEGTRLMSADSVCLINSRDTIGTTPDSKLAVFGATCGCAIDLGQGDTCASNIIMTDSVMWFKFVANSPEMRMKIAMPDSMIYIDKLKLFTTINCSNFNLLAEAATIQNDTIPIDRTQRGINLDSLIVGNTYYVQVLKKPNVANAIFDLCVEKISLLTGVCLSFGNVNLCKPVSFVNYSGSVNNIATGYYYLTYTLSGSFTLQNVGAAWYDCNGGAVNALNLTCLPGSSGIVYTADIPSTATQGQTGSVTFTLKNYLGQDVCTTTTYVNIVNPISAGSDIIICQGASANLNATTDTNIGGATGGSTYIWSPSTDLSCTICANPVASPNSTTVYTVTGVTSPGGCTGSDAVTVTVIPPPSMSFTLDQNKCMGDPVNFSVNVVEPYTTYSWNFGDPASGNNTAAGPTASHSYNNGPGNYIVTFTASNTCFTNSSTAIVTIIPSTSIYNIGCCSENPLLYTDNFVNISTPLSTPTDWNGVSKVIKNVLQIFPNCSLTIRNNSNIQFGPLGKIIIQPGGKLTVDNSTIKGLNACGTMWQGIQVLGDACKSQASINPMTNNIYQGKVIIQNGSVIQGAHNAVVAGLPNGAFFTTNKGGGIIIATNSSFFDNGISIRFGTYYNFTNISGIDNCIFNSGILSDPGYDLNNPAGYKYPDANNLFYGYASAAKHAYAYGHLLGVRGLTFRDNTFNNAEYGVLSANSSSKYLDADNSGTSNIFTNMTYGMRHTYFWSTIFGNIIEFNKFDQTFGVAPIYIDAGTNDRIKRNVIDDPTNPNGYFVGIGLINSASPYIVDNTIDNCFFGVAVVNTGSYGLIGYEQVGNTFTNCAWATWLPGNNLGLKIRCNTYKPIGSNYMKNWYVGGTLPNQYTNWPILTDKDPSGNNFNLINPGTLNDIYSNVNLFDYYHHNPTPAFPAVQPAPSGVLTATNIINTTIGKTGTSCDPPPNPCPPPLPPCDPQRIQQLSEQITSLQIEFNTVLANLDKGQTAQLLSAIGGNTSNGNLKNMLLQNSPLSDEVLTAYLNKNGNPPGHVKEVFIPNSPVSDAVRSLLYVKLASMPPGISTQIKDAQVSNAYRTLTAISLELESTKIRRQGVVADAINFYADNDMQQDAINLLEAENTMEAGQTLAGTYLANGDYSSASAKLNSMTASNPEEQAFIDLQNSLLTVYASGRSIYEMDSAEVQLVRNIAGSSVSSIARSNACAILFFVFNEDCGMDINAPSQRMMESNLSNKDEMNGNPYNYLGASFPNPATNKVYIPYSLPEESGGIMNIYDVNGKTLGSFILRQGENILEINTGELPSGVYAYGITIDGVQADTKRMVIIKE